MSKRPDFSERVAYRIKDIREKTGMEIEALSNQTGLSINALRLIESGRRDIKVSELFLVSKALDIRITALLAPCDHQLYSRRKEENLDCYISLKDLSEILDISEKRLRELCRNNEIPHLEISRKHFFKASDINIWLEHHLGSKKKIKKPSRSIVKIYGIEPLFSPKEAGEILGCSHTFVRRLGLTVPYYRIGGRIKYRISDIENYRDSRKVDPWEISTRVDRWKSRFVWPEPSQEENLLKALSFDRKYDENARPGYVVRQIFLESPDLDELKGDVDEFIKNNIPVKSNLLVYRYYNIRHHRLYGCELKWWALPEGRKGYKVHSTGLKSSSPDDLRDKVEKYIETKIPKKDFIEVSYFNFPFSFYDKQHHARITYYLPFEVD
jgi:transcriptional regulator with XRE-family HTH domain